MKTSSTFSTILMAFFVSFVGFDSILLGQSARVGGSAQETTPAKKATTEDDGSLFGLDENMSERLLSSLKKGALSKNETVCYQSLLMLSKQPDMLQKFGAEVQRELVKRSLEQDSTNSLGFEILIQSEISGVQRQELLLNFFKSTFRSTGNSSVDRKSVLRELVVESKAIVERFANEIDEEPLGEHTDKLLVIEHLGPFAEKAVPALLKRYHAINALAAKEGRLPNYMDLLFTIGEIQSKDAMEIILDACEERGSDERERYVMVGFECLNRIIATPNRSRSDAKYATYVQRLIKTYDEDSDGFLNKDEMAKMRRPIDMRYDRNRDRRLDQSEIMKSLSRSSSSRSSSRPKALIRDSVSFN